MAGYEHDQEIKDVLNRLRTSGTYSDALIKCNGTQFNVHRAIICPRSAVLRATLDGNFKEAESDTIDLSEDDPCIVSYMLDYLYTADYDGSESNFESLDKSAARQPSSCKDIEEYEKSNTVDSPDDPISEHDSITLQTAKTFHMRTHVRVWAIGDRYDIVGLRALAEDKFEKCLKGGEWDSPEFSNVVAEVYDCTTVRSRLRTIAVEYSAKNIHELMDKGEFNGLIRDASGFGGDLLAKRTCSNLRTSKGETFEGYCQACRYAVESSELITDSLEGSIPTHHCPNCRNHFNSQPQPVTLWD